MTAPGSLRSPASDAPQDALLRSYVLSVRLTPAERLRVLKASRAMGISASTLGRLRLLGEPLPAARPTSPPLAEVNIDTYRELGRIGNNVNQLARHFNLRSGDDPTSGEVLVELRRLSAVVREVQWTWARS